MRGDPVVPVNVGYETQTVLIGDVVEERIDITPGYHMSEVLVMNVGLPKKTRQLVAVAGHEDAWIKSDLDLIKVSATKSTKNHQISKVMGLFEVLIPKTFVSPQRLAVFNF